MLVTFSSIEQGECVVLPVSVVPVRQNTRRLSRSATLDGGAVITDSGISDADRTFDFTAKQVPESLCDALWAMFTTESLVHLACPEGVFAGYLQQVRITGADIIFSFMVQEKIT